MSSSIAIQYRGPGDVSVLVDGQDWTTKLAGVDVSLDVHRYPEVTLHLAAKAVDVYVYHAELIIEDEEE